MRKVLANPGDAPPLPSPTTPKFEAPRSLATAEATRTEPPNKLQIDE
jgi:hypothetical protein